MITSTEAIVNQLLNRIRERERLSEQGLAERLKVDPATVYRWRKGDLGKAASTLLPLLAEEYERRTDIAHAQITS